MIESRRRNLFLALCALVLLHTGVHLSQSFVNYPGWYVLEAESFKATDWIRNVPEWGRTALYVWALSRLIAPSPSGRPAT
jgi:hypothetical protein